jgi:hypothetical protein
MSRQQRFTFLFISVQLFVSFTTDGQELYVFTEPASNIPAHSVSGKMTWAFVPKDNIYQRFSQRFMPEIMFGISKKIMVHISSTWSDMHTSNIKFESASVYGKYRFFSQDDLHKHFRMSVYAEASKSYSPFHYDEVSLMGDKGGIEAGLIATQLWNKFALSATISHTQVLHESRFNDVVYLPTRAYQSMNYSLSAGYLLFPAEYSDYSQLNVNLYTEMLAQQTLDIRSWYVDLCPAMQLIFNSNSKLNIGYRFQMGSNQQRMAKNSWQISFERIFLNALKPGKKRNEKDASLQ